MDKPIFREYFTDNVYFEREEECVLVGSSGRVLLTRLGDRIDKCKTIVRMNSAPTHEYEQFVGNRTDIRIIAFNAIGLVLKNPKTMIGVKKIFIWSGENHFEKTKKDVNLYSKMYRNVKFYYLTPYGYNLVVKEFQKKSGNGLTESGSWISTGLIAIFILTLLYKEVNIVGFGDFSGDGSSKKIPYHYWKDDLSNQSEETHYIKNQMNFTGHRFLIEENDNLRLDY